MCRFVFCQTFFFSAVFGEIKPPNLELSLNVWDTLCACSNLSYGRDGKVTLAPSGLKCNQAFQAHEVAHLLLLCSAASGVRSAP